MPTNRRKIELCGAAEGAALLGISPARWHQLSGRRDFPKPYATLTVARIWAADDLREWNSRRKTASTPRPSRRRVPVPAQEPIVLP